MVSAFVQHVLTTVSPSAVLYWNPLVHWILQRYILTVSCWIHGRWIGQFKPFIFSTQKRAWLLHWAARRIYDLFIVQPLWVLLTSQCTSSYITSTAPSTSDSTLNYVQILDVNFSETVLSVFILICWTFIMSCHLWKSCLINLTLFGVLLFCYAIKLLWMKAAFVYRYQAQS